ALLGGGRQQRVDRLECGCNQQVPVGLRTELDARPGRRRISIAVLPGEQPTRGWTERGDGDPFLRREGKHVGLDGAVEQTVAILDRLVPVDTQDRKSTRLNSSH